MFGGTPTPPSPPKPIDAEARAQKMAQALRNRQGFLSTVMNRSTQSRPATAGTTAATVG